MEVINSIESTKLRELFIQTFVNTASDYYINRINKLIEFSDGICYTGYLWDCLKNPCVVSEDAINDILKNKKNIFVMWDIHSSDRILIPNYWKYPKTSILFFDDWTEDSKKTLPEDIYLFDSSFTWYAVYTHEEDISLNRYCLYWEQKT